MAILPWITKMPDGRDWTFYGETQDDVQRQKDTLIQKMADEKNSSPSDPLGPALEGMTGGALDELSGVVGAVIGPVVEGKTMAEGYRKGYEGSKARREQFARTNPKTSAALELGGNIAGFAALPEIKAAEALGAGATVGGRLLNAAATAGLGGAIEGAGKAESPHGLDSTPGEVAAATLGGAAQGAVEAAPLGPAGEIAGGAVGGLVKRGAAPVRNFIFGDATRGGAEARIAQALLRDNPNATPEQLAQRMLELRDQGYAPTIGDIGGESTRGMARAAADVSPEARTMFREATGPRSRGQVDRTQAVIERASGGVGPETRFGIQDVIKQARKERGVLYDDAYAADRAAGGIPWTPGMAHLAQNEPIFKNAMKRGARNFDAENNARIARGEQPLDIVGTTPDPRGALSGQGGSGPRGSLAYWDQVKRVLDGAETTALKKNKPAARIIGQIRDHLRDHLTATVPEYQRALGTFHQLFGGADAGEAGVMAFDKGLSGLELGRAMSDMTDSEQRMFRASWISKFSEDVGKVKDIRDLSLRLADSKDARIKLNLMFGREGTNQITSHRDIEEMLMRLPNEVSGNSKSIRYAMGVGALAGAATGGGVGGFSLLDPTTWGPALGGAAAGALLGRGGAAIRRGLTEKSATWIAEGLSSGDPELLRRITNAAQTSPAVRAVLSRLGKAITAGGIAQEQGHGPLKVFVGQPDPTGEYR